MVLRTITFLFEYRCQRQEIRGKEGKPSVLNMIPYDWN